MAPIGGVAAGVLASAALLGLPAPAAGAGAPGTAALQQAGDTVSSDTAAADTVPREGVPPGMAPGDTLPGDTAAAGRDTADGGREPYFPEALPVPDSAYSAVVWRCDRECLLDSSASNLLDLLEAEWPGAVPLRGTYFGGPHHLADGLAGSALTEVRVEELPVPELAGGQVDLTRVPLAWLSEVQIIRRAGEMEVRLVPVRHRTPQAYSRVTVGTGEPNVNLIRGLFANGLGNHVSVSTGIDLLNSEGQLAGSDRLDFWGMAAWTPDDGEGGAELLWRTQSMTRFDPGTGAAGGEDVPREFDRRDAYLRGRGRVAEGVRVHLAAGRSEWIPAAEDAAGPGAPSGDRPDTGPRVEAEGATLALQAERPWGFGRAAFETWTGPSRPGVRGSVAGGFRPVAGLRVDGAARAGRWRGFTTASYRGGVRWSPGLGGDVTLHVSGARGTRGVPRPWLGRADSLRFGEYRAGASLSLGPYRFSGLAALQDFSRQLPFSATFDRALPPVPDAEVLMGQGGVRGPVVPVGDILDADVSPVEIDLSYRRSRSRGQRRPLYVPLNLVQAQFRFRDEFFEGDLGVAARFGVRYRSAMTSADPSAGEAAAVPSRAATDWSIVLRIVGARVWYRAENANRILPGNLVGQQYPPIRNTFGVKWEFTN